MNDPFKEIMNAILVRKIMNKLLRLEKPITLETREVITVGPNYIKYNKKTIKALPKKMDIELLRGYALYLSKNKEEMRRIIGDV